MILVFIDLLYQILRVFNKWHGFLVYNFFSQTWNDDLFDKLVFFNLTDSLILHLVIHFPGVSRLRNVTVTTFVITELTLKLSQLGLRIIIIHIIIIVINQIFQHLLCVSPLSLWQ